MNKKQILLAAFAIFTVALFLLESFSVGFLRSGALPFGNNVDNPDQQIVTTENGIAEFDAAFAYYESYILSKDELTQERIKEIKMDNRVLGITNSQQGYVIEVKTREDVAEVYDYLKSINISANGVANFAAPSVIVVNLTNGKTIETANNERLMLRLDLVPSIKPGTKVRLQMAVRVQNNAINAYGQPRLAITPISFNATAIVKQTTGQEVTLTIPWEQRNSINASQLMQMYGNNSVSYNKKDSITFAPPLTVGQIKEKKELGYITFISESSASINQSFSDKEQIQKDFTGLNMTFPASSLVISANKIISLPYNSTARYTYQLELRGVENLDEREITLSLDKLYNVDDEIPVIVDALMEGGQIKAISSVSVLSENSSVIS